jgi:hypothetical protein
MRKAILSSVALVAFLGAMPLAANAASSSCPEGRTLSGACVNPGLARAMRDEALVYSQPKFSHQNSPVPPSDDGVYFTPPDFSELSRLFGGGRPGGAGCVPTFTHGC